MKTSKTLYIFSLYTPIEQAESFLKNEIDLWLKEANINIIVVPTRLTKKKYSDIPEFVDISLSNLLLSRKKTKLLLLINPLNLIKCIRHTPRKHRLKINAYREVFDALVEQVITRKWLKNLNLLETESLFYSFWLNNIILSSADFFKNTNTSVISRTHRFDLYEETQKYNFFPFREKLISNLDLLIPASKNAEIYLTKKYGSKVQILLKKLGVEIPKDILLNNPNDNDTKTIVSCSVMKKVKRVELIAERLVIFCINNPSMNINWIHFGKGELEPNIMKILKNKPINLKFKIHDFTPNSTLLTFYKQNWIDAFINLSSSEGQPVSIMEVMAHGIPCIATDTGGVSELINENTGILLNIHHKPEHFNNALLKIIGQISFNRLKIRDYIKDNNSLENQFLSIKTIVNNFYQNI